MPSYTYSGPGVVLPALSLEVGDGDTVDLPHGFYSAAQAAAVGFTPAKKKPAPKKSTPKTATPESEPAHADPQQ